MTLKLERLPLVVWSLVGLLIAGSAAMCVTSPGSEAESEREAVRDAARLHGGAIATYGPFASAIVFGLMFAMIGTLYVVPLTYTALIRTQEALARSAVRFRTRLGFASEEPQTVRE